jgi:hypothetical protein
MGETAEMLGVWRKTVRHWRRLAAMWGRLWGYASLCGAGVCYHAVGRASGCNPFAVGKWFGSGGLRQQTATTSSTFRRNFGLPCLISARGFPFMVQLNGLAMVALK